MQQGLTAQRATGSSVRQVHCSVLLAEAHGHAGQGDGGLHLLAEAEAAMEQTDERFYEAELWRIKGELMLQKGAGEWGRRVGPLSPQAPSLKPLVPMGVVEEAEGYFRKAITIARHQQAKSLELRAAMSLARLWQCQGKRSTAYELLAPIYHWFTEGFDTADLQEAQALLEELS